MITRSDILNHFNRIDRRTTTMVDLNPDQQHVSFFLNGRHSVAKPQGASSWRLYDMITGYGVVVRRPQSLFRAIDALIAHHAPAPTER